MKPIKNYEGLYAITSCGKVWSYKTNKFLAPTDSGQGYQMVHLCKNGKGKPVKIHKLVAEAYLVNDDPVRKTDIGHLDGIKTHNYVGNLQYMTRSENIAQNNLKNVKKNFSRILCVETGEVFDSQAAAAREKNICRQSIVNVLAGRQTIGGGYHWERIIEEDYE